MKIHNKTRRSIILILVFATVSVFGLNLITGDQQPSNIGTSLASAQEPADINSDNTVDIVDLSILLSNWSTADSLSDLNNDNIVDIVDLSILLSKWGVVDVTQVRACLGKPDSGCTGVTPGTTLTNVLGDLVVNTNGAVIEDRDIQGFLIIDASNVVVKNTIVRGRATSQNGAYINIRSGTNILIEDTEVSPTTPYVYLDGIHGSNFTGRRLNIHGGVDGMKVYDNVRIEDSYIHDMQYFSSDPNQGGGNTHNDAIQILRGTNIGLVGNNLEVSRSHNAAIQITQDFGTVNDVIVESNWMDGGGCTVNIAHKVQGSLNGVTLQNNRFGRDSYWNCPILLSTQSNVTLTNNVWDDTGIEVPVQIHD